MDLVLLVGLSYGLYRLAIGYNIAPWRWVIRFVTIFMLSVVLVVSLLTYYYGPSLMKDPDLMKKLAPFVPYTLLYEVILFLLFRSRMGKYVLSLDAMDNTDNSPPPPPSKDKTKDKTKDEPQDFSYFR
jgi:hypothetical protein